MPYEFKAIAIRRFDASFSPNLAVDGTDNGLFIGADDAVLRRRYCDDFVTMYVGVYVCR